ncbi:MAG TPA: tetratricopeptide repeat protein [Phycisphaerae bacterium]
MGTALLTAGVVAAAIAVGWFFSRTLATPDSLPTAPLPAHPNGRDSVRPGPPTKLPPLARAIAADGKIQLRVDEPALLSACRSAGIPAPPPLTATDTFTFELIYDSTRAAVDLRSGERLGRLGAIYQGNGFSDRALECYRLAVSLDPTLYKWWHLLGVLQQELGQSAAAIDSFRHAMQLSPGDAAALMRLGDLLFDQQDLEEAGACFDKYIALRPDDTLGHFGAGKVALARNQFDDARRHLSAAVRCDARHQAAHYLLGRALEHLHQPADAAASFAAAAALPIKSVPRLDDPVRDEMYEASRSTSVLQQYMVELQQQGRTEDAYLVAVQLVARRPDDFLNLRNLATLARLTHRPAEALRAAQQAVEINPNFAPGYATFSEVLREQQRYDEALAAVDRALELEPEDGSNLLTRGSVLLQIERYEEALDVLERGLRVLPNHVNGHALRAAALLGLSRVPEAHEELERVLQLDPTHAWAQQHLARLNSTPAPSDDGPQR